MSHTIPKVGGGAVQLHPSILVAHASGRIIGDLDDAAIGLGMTIGKEFFPFAVIRETKGEITRMAYVVTLPTWHTLDRKMRKPPVWTRQIKVAARTRDGAVREPRKQPPLLPEYRRWNPSW